MNTQSPKTLSDIIGAEQIGSLVPVVMEFAAGTAVIERGTIVSVDSVGGKLVPTAAGNEATAYGIVLDESIDTAVAIDSKVTGSVARHGSFKASELLVATGTDMSIVIPTLRQNGLYLEGSVATAAAAAASATAPVQPHHHKK